MALAPPKGRGAQRVATKKTLCTPGDDKKPMTRGTSKKWPQQKNPDSLTAALDRDAHSLLFRGDFSGRARLVFFLLRPRADAHSLTAGLGGDASPSPGWCFFFCCGPARTGVVFFFCCGPARTLTHSLWAGAISARPGWCFFFLLRPRRTRRANNKKCLVYYIGSKRTRRGHSKKKQHHFPAKPLNPEAL